MLNLAEYRNKPQSLADFLPWAALVGEGVILNKDGSFQRTARFRGPDLDSATPAELVATTSRLNNALRRLDSGWAVFVEAQRVAAASYPNSRFPDPVSTLVDAERRAQFEEAGAHFESAYFLTLCWLPPAEVSALLQAADVAALPFTHGLTTKSGSLLAVLDHGLPLVGTRGDGTEAALEGAGRLGPVRESRVLADNLGLALAEGPRPAARRLADEHRWDAIAKAHVSVYETVCRA